MERASEQGPWGRQWRRLVAVGLSSNPKEPFPPLQTEMVTVRAPPCTSQVRDYPLRTDTK